MLTHYHAPFVVETWHCRGGHRSIVFEHGSTPVNGWPITNLVLVRHDTDSSIDNYVVLFFISL